MQVRVSKEDRSGSMHMIRVGVAAVAMLILQGCTGGSFMTLVQGLNERQVQSCIRYEGNAGPYLRVMGITATGGVKLAECLP